MKEWTTLSICCISGCSREIHHRKRFCAEHWTLVPWLLKEWLVNSVTVSPDPAFRGYTVGREWAQALRECKRAVEEFVRDSRPTLHG